MQTLLEDRIATGLRQTQAVSVIGEPEEDIKPAILAMRAERLADSNPDDEEATAQPGDPTEGADGPQFVTGDEFDIEALNKLEDQWEPGRVHPFECRLRKSDDAQAKELTRAEWAYIKTLEGKTAVAYWCGGRGLLILRRQLPHGDFMNFVASLGISQSRADRSMALAKRYDRPEKLVGLTLYEALGYERPTPPPKTQPAVLTMVPAPAAIGPVTTAWPDEEEEGTPDEEDDAGEAEAEEDEEVGDDDEVAAEPEQAPSGDFIVRGDFRWSLPQGDSQVHDCWDKEDNVIGSVNCQCGRWYAVIELGKFASRDEAMAAAEEAWDKIQG